MSLSPFSLGLVVCYLTLVGLVLLSAIIFLVREYNRMAYPNVRKLFAPVVTRLWTVMVLAMAVLLCTDIYRFFTLEPWQRAILATFNYVGFATGAATYTYSVYLRSDCILSGHPWQRPIYRLTVVAIGLLALNLVVVILSYAQVFGSSTIFANVGIIVCSVLLTGINLCYCYFFTAYFRRKAELQDSKYVAGLVVARYGNISAILQVLGIFLYATGSLVLASQATAAAVVAFLSRFVLMFTVWSQMMMKFRLQSPAEKQRQKQQDMATTEPPTVLYTQSQSQSAQYH